MEIVPLTAGIASRDWDEQSLDLRGAREQVSHADAGGFTTAVAGTARGFVRAWTRHLTGLETMAEGHADGLRVTIDDWLKTDGANSLTYVQLCGYLNELR